MPDLVPMPGFTVVGQEWGPPVHNTGIPFDVYNWLYLGGQQPSFANFVYGAIAAPPNWVATGGGLPPAPPVQQEELPEIEVVGTMPPLDTLSPGELEEIGTDAAFNELERRGFIFNEPAYDPTDAFVWPQIVYPPVIAPIATVVARLLPFLAPFLPMPGGDKDLDEAPAPGGRRGPPRRPIDIPLDPILPPNWEDLARPRYDFEVDNPGKPAPGPYPWPDRTDRVGRVVPIGDYPGMLDDPFGFPELPAPSYFPKPGPAPSDRPGRIAPDPFSNPWPTYDPDPFRAPQPEPRVFPGPAQFPLPNPFDEPFPDVVADPVPIAPPRIGDPFVVAAPGNPPIPSLPTIPRPLDPFVDPIGAPDPMPFPDPFVPPDRFDAADPCGCQEKKKKKKKKQGRVVCYKGTYYENRNSLTKVKRERIPCKRSEGTAKRKSPAKQPTLPDLAKDIFGLP